MPASPCAVVMLLDAAEDLSVAIDVLRKGASGVLAHDVAAPRLREAVLAVLRGEAVVAPDVASEVVRQVRLAERPD